MPDDDRQRADTWRRASTRTQLNDLEAAWTGQRCGPALVAAMLDTLEHGDAESGNAALRLLASTDLSAAELGRVARVARRERGQVLPDREAAVFLAQHGSPSTLPTVVLTALRQGPEDADDRLLAIAGLGRFGDARVPPMLARLAATGTATLEVLQAVATGLAHDDAAETWGPVLHAVLHLHNTDAWARWAALDGLSRLDPTAAVPWLVAACRSGGDDLPPWYAPFCQQRLHALAPQVDPQTWRDPLPEMRPLPDRRARLNARCARIARQAMAEWQAMGGDAPPVLARAGLELALVQRGQLLGSFVAQSDTVAVEPDATWQANWLVMGLREREAWQAAEDAWLA